MMRFPRWIVSAILALQLLLSLLQLLDAHGVWYFPMIHGLAYSLRFDLGFSLLPALLPVSALVLGYLLKEGKYRGSLIAASVSIGLYLIFGIEAAVAWFSIFQIALALLHFLEIGEFLFWLLAFMTGFEATALIHWVLLPFGIVTPLAWFADLELAMFYILAPLAPFVVITIFLIVIFKLLAPQYLAVVGQLYRLYSSPKVETKKETINLHPRARAHERRVRLRPWVFLTLSLFFSVVGSLYPYNYHLNPEGEPVGIDVQAYVNMTVPLEENLYSAFSISGGSRPLILFLIFGFHQVFGLGILDAVKYVPVLLNPLLSLSVYFMVVNATGDEEWGGLASLFSALCFTTTVGMYSYFLANMLGLVLMFSALGFLLKAIRTGNKISLVASSVFGSLVLFSHPWTFTQYYAAIALLLVYKFFREKKFNESKMILFYLITTGLVDLIKWMTGSIEISGSLASTSPKLVELAAFWNNNISAFRLLYGGLLANSILFGLSIIGIYLLNHKESYHLTLILLLLVSSPYYLIVNSDFQTRILYNIPFSVFATLGIFLMFKSSKFDMNKKILILLFTIIYMMVYFLRSIANIV